MEHLVALAHPKGDCQEQNYGGLERRGAVFLCVPQSTTVRVALLNWYRRLRYKPNSLFGIAERYCGDVCCY